MQSLFFVNSDGNLVVPSRHVLFESLSKIKSLPALFPSNWPTQLVEGSCDMPVLEGMSGSVPEVNNSRAVICRSQTLWKKFLRTDCVVVNGVALKCWGREYPVGQRPKSSIVFICDGLIDKSGDGYDLAAMDMKTNPIVFVEKQEF